MPNFDPVVLLGNDFVDWGFTSIDSTEHYVPVGPNIVWLILATPTDVTMTLHAVRTAHNVNDLPQLALADKVQVLTAQRWYAIKPSPEVYGVRRPNGRIEARCTFSASSGVRFSVAQYRK